MHLKYTRWFISLSSKLARVVPVRTSWVILLTLVAQVAHILAFFLPLKIVILLGSDGIPRYFPPLFVELDRDILVVALSVATVVFYSLNVIAEKIIEKVTKSATQVILRRSHKLALFENQNEIAASAYQRFSRALAGLIFSGLAILGLVFIYLELAIVMGGFITVAVVGTLIAYSYNDAAKAYIQTQLNALTDYLSAAGFFVVFGYLVLDFVWLTPPNIIIAIIAILLGRQTFSRLSRAVVDITRLSEQQHKINSLFFHGQALAPVTDSTNDSFWSLMMPEHRGEWIDKLLEEFEIDGDNKQERIEENLHWLEVVLPQIGAFLYRSGSAVYLIKLYDRRKMLAAEHSFTLFSDMPENLPAPGFVGNSFVQGYPCALFRLESGKSVSKKQYKHLQLEFLSELMAVKPSSAITSRYLRSRPSIVQRMTTQWLDKAIIAARLQRQHAAITSLRNHWHSLQLLLTDLPLAFHNPSFKPWDIWQAQEDKSLILLNWERWSIEPLGAGWPTSEMDMESLENAYPEVAEKRQDLQNSPAELLMLAALLFELERLVQKQQLDAALKVVVRMSPLLETVLVIQDHHNSGIFDEL